MIGLSVTGCSVIGDAKFVGIEVGNITVGNSVEGEAEGGTVGSRKGKVDGENVLNEGMEEGSSIGDCDSEDGVV